MKLNGGALFRIPLFYVAVWLCLLGMSLYSVNAFAVSGGAAGKKTESHVSSPEDGVSDAHASDAGHGENSGSGGGGGHGESTQHWKTSDTARVLNFVVLVLILVILLRKPLKEGLRNRASGIQENLIELEKKEIEAKKKLKEYNEKLASLETEAKNIVDEYIKQGEEAREKIVEHARSISQKMEEQAKKNIAFEFNQAKIKLQTEVMEKAIAKAESLIRNSLNEEDQNKLIDEYLEKVEA